MFGDMDSLEVDSTVHEAIVTEPSLDENASDSIRVETDFGMDESESIIDDGSAPKDSCNVDRLLRLRADLAVLRRRLFHGEVKQLLLRRIYSHVLLPAAVRHSPQLHQRSWRSIRYHKVLSRLRSDKYRDYVSGWDLGS